jgi:hypothetical protein
VENGQPDKPGKAAADTLVNGLADQEFWDGEVTVRLLSWLRVAVVGGFLAIVLGVTVRALRGGSPRASALGWTGIALGATTIALAAGYLVLDALDTPAMAPPGRHARPGRLRRETPWAGGVAAVSGVCRADLLGLVRLAAARRPFCPDS